MIIINYYNEIENKIIDEEVYQSVKDYSKEQHKVNTYFEIGELLYKAGKHYGENIIGQYAKKLVSKFGKKYDKSNLFRMKQFYFIFGIKKVAPLEQQLSWSHFKILVPIKDFNEMNYYIQEIKKRKLSKRQLENIIKSKEFERLPENTKIKFQNNNELSIEDYIKDPIIINTDKDIVSEKVLKQLILEDISSFMKQLGDGYSFIDSEYKIMIDNRPNYIDILLFNIKYNCYVVIELKITEVKKEHIGQIQVYMNYINKNLKTIYQDNTIGIIIAKKKNKFVISYSSDHRIYETTYSIKNKSTDI